MIKHFFIPTDKNKYTPHLLSKSALLVYILMIFSFNFLITSVGFVKVNASFAVQDLLIAHNNQRALSGLPALKLNSTLSASATSKANAMMASNCWSHYCPNGKDWRDFFVESGYEYIHAGENLAEGFETVDSVVSAWMNSQSHRDNILNGSFSEVGFGFAFGDFQGSSDNTIIVVHFGTEIKQTQEFIPVSDQPIQTVEQPEISITSPQTGTYTADRQFEITGNINPDNSTVAIITDNEESGRVQASGDHYAYRPVRALDNGRHLVKSRLLQDSSVLAESDTIEVIVDNVAPEVLQEDLRAYNNDSEIEIIISMDEEVVEFDTDNEFTDITDIDKKHFTIKISEANLEKSEDLSFDFVDRAGNFTNFTFSKDRIFDLIEASKDLEVLDLNSSAVDDRLIAKLFDSIFDRNVKASFAILFVTYLIVLLVIDFLFLNKIDMLHIERSKTHIHLSSFIILLLILLLGGVTGNILQGISS